MMNRTAKNPRAARGGASPLVSMLLSLAMSLSLFVAMPPIAFADEEDPLGQDAPLDGLVDDAASLPEQATVEPDDDTGDADAATGDADADAVDDAGAGDDDVITPMADGIPDLCTISSSITASRSLDIPAASTANGARVQLWDNNATPAQRFQVSANGDGSYTIKNVNSGLALDVRYANASNGAVVWQYTANGTDAQRWYITNEGNGFKIASKLNPTYCLDVPAANAENGAQLQLYTSNGTNAQRFNLNAITRPLADGAYTIASDAANLVLDINAASSANGAVAQLYAPNQTLAQRFILTYDGKTGYYTVTNVQSNKVLDVSAASHSNGAKVQIYQANGTGAQKWSITLTTDNRYRITAAHSGKALGLPAGTVGNFTPVQTFDHNDSAGQQWRFNAGLTVDEGTYQVRAATGTVLDAKGNGQSNGTQVWAYSPNGTIAQKYFMKHVSDGYYKIDCLNSGLLLTVQGTNVVLHQDLNNATQLWKPQPAGEGRFSLINKETGKALDIIGGSTASGTNVQVYAPNNTRAQLWAFEATYAMANGLYIVRSALDNGKVLDIMHNSSENGAKLQLFTANGSVAQVFQFTQIGYPYYRITCLNSNKALDVNSGVLSPKGIVQLWDAASGTTNKNQVWRADYAGGGSYRFFSACGDGTYCLTVDGGVAQDYAEVNVFQANNTQAQLFKLSFQGNSTYVQLNITLDQMVQYQRGNVYINDISDQYLRDVIDPSKTMADYNYPSHSTQYRHGMLQFADLRSYTGLTAAQMDTIINASTSSGSVLRGKGPVFVQAAKQYNINEGYLLAHCALESGWGTSELARGYAYNGVTLVDGKTWPAGTYYNLFGIGAVDSGPLSGGRAYAVMNGWDSIDKAIIGGAKWIVEGYIYRDIHYPPYGQPTLYAMKWDYSRSNATSAYGWHQYATDHLWARKIARMMGDFYSSVGHQPSLVYIIPRYR
jgi:beta-N-acetylglucosaminidase